MQRLKPFNNVRDQSTCPPTKTLMLAADSVHVLNTIPG